MPAAGVAIAQAQKWAILYYIPVGDGASKGASRWMKAAGIVIDEEHYRKVANAKDIDRRTYTTIGTILSKKVDNQTTI
ncbi:MAG: hypothetical protein V7K89_08180 [Nostoc sp.]|uniref:hypothetical protein n=1 Tax=Nostoc sp. TaxID=1180 RepID=UPI002FF623E6